MKPEHASKMSPNWDSLFSVLLEQQGYFTTGQAAGAGYSLQLIHHHLQAGQFQRVARGIYRLVHYPPCEHEQLVVAWLWAEQQGIIGFETALALHGLTDVLSSKIHLIVPRAWSERRLRVPGGIRLHFADVGMSDRAWMDGVPMTTPARTVCDCVLEHVSPELIRQAVDQGVARGLFALEQISPALEYLESF